MRDGKGFRLGGEPIKSAAAFYAAAKEVLGEELFNKYDFQNAYPVSDEQASFLSRRLAVEGLTGFGGNMKNRYFGAYRAKKFPGAKTYTYIFSHVTPHTEDDKKIPQRDPDRMLAWHLRSYGICSTPCGWEPVVPATCRLPVPGRSTTYSWPTR